MWRRLPLAWLQLVHQKMRLAAAVAGVAFACVLMFMQFGFQDALFASATLVQQQLRTDLVVINSRSEALFAMRNFSRRRLYQVAAHPEVERVTPMYVGLASWKNPWNARARSILVLGLEPWEPLLDLPGVADGATSIAREDAVLFDSRSRAEFGDVPGALAEGEPVFAEVNGRQLEVVGLFTLGASFAADGTLVTSDLNFRRIFSDRRPEAIDVGAVRLAPGADAVAVRAELARELAPDVRVLTHAEFVEFERDYWATSTAIGFIFTLGALMGFVVGAIIAYQIIYTDVSNHLPEYATLKAMGYTDRYLLGVVFQEALLLSILGFLPGAAISWWLFRLTEQATFMPMEMTLYRLVLVLALTIAMCFASGLVAVRKLRQADPADIF